MNGGNQSRNNENSLFGETTVGYGGILEGLIRLVCLIGLSRRWKLANTCTQGQEDDYSFETPPKH